MDNLAYINFGDFKYIIDSKRGEQLEVKHEIIKKQKIMTFTAKIKKNSLLQFNYNTFVKIGLIKNDKEEIIFGGVILKTKIYGEYFILKGYDASIFLKEKIFSGEFIKLNIFDILYHIAKLSGYSPLIPDSSYSKNIFYKFRILIPINNLIINNEIFFNNIKVSKIFDNEIKKEIIKSKFKKKFFSKSISIAEIIIESTDFIEAHKIAKNKVIEVIDWLSYIKNFSLNKVDEYFFSWDIKLQKSLPKISTFFYGENLNNNSKIIINSEIKNNIKKLIINKKNNNIFVFFKYAFENSYKNKSNIKNALHWLRRAREFGNQKDKLSDYIKSVEFLICKEKQEILFKENDINNLIEASKSFLKNNQLKRYMDYIKGINSSSFNSRLKSFLKKIDLKLSQKEEKIIRDNRKKRNLIEHGIDDVDITNEDLNILSNIVEKLLIHSANK